MTGRSHRCVHAESNDVMSHFVVERFVPGATGADVQSWGVAIERAIASLDVDGTVSYLGSELMTDDETCLCFFAGPDAEAIRRVNAAAGVSYERIVTAEAIGWARLDRQRDVSPAAGGEGVSHLKT